MLNSILGKIGLRLGHSLKAALPTDIDVPEASGSIYGQDGIHTGHNHDFIRQPAFVAAYNRGVQAAGEDYNWHWRVHVGLWAASVAARLPGDFVECGVNRGFLSSAIMQYLDWNSRDKRFYLLDTFNGLDFRFVSDEELAKGAEDKNQAEIDRGFYTTEVDSVRKNFAQWRNVSLIVGAVPETLSQITSKQIAFVSVDMNCAPPEVAAMEFLWPKLVEGAMVVFDDYAYHGYRPQKVALDKFARERSVSILSMPTGQGLLVKSPGY